MYVHLLDVEEFANFAKSLTDDEQHNFSILTMLISVMRKVVMLS